MKRNKMYAIILAIALALTFIPGCGSTTGTNPTATNPPAVNSPGGAEATAAADEKVSLKFATDKPATHSWSLLDQQWIELIYEMSGGSIEIEPYWQDTLVPSASGYTETVAGVTDIIMITAGKETEHFIIESRMKYFMWGLNDRETYLAAIQEVFDAVPEWQAEYENVHILGWDTTGELQIQATVPINSVADVSGLSLRCTDDRTVELFSLLGASPIKMPNSEMYESLSKNVIQGTLVPNEALKSTSIADLVKCSYQINLFAGWEIMRYINLDTWNSLSANQQAILTEASAQRAQWQAAANAADGEWTTESVEYSLEKDVEFKECSAEDTALINSMLEQMALGKAEELNSLGYDGDHIYETARSIVEKYL